MTDVEALRWVSEEQESYLEDSRTSVWERDWPEYLVKYLEQSWPSWQSEEDGLRFEWLESRAKSVGLGWITEDQRRQLDGAAAVLGDWKLWLPLKLDQLWTEWAMGTTEQLANWFAQVLPSLLPLRSPRELDWVTAAQRTELEKFAGQRGDWRTWLPPQMDEWWPDWTQSDPDTLSKWLTQAIAGLAAAPPASAAEDLRELAWVTDEQQALLEKFNGQRGEWRTWLPSQMDAWWPDWIRSDSVTVSGWLNGAIPGLGTPPADQAAEPGFDTGEPSPEAITELYREQEEADDQEFLVDKLMNEVIRPALESGELDELTPDEIAELLERAVAAAQGASVTG